MEWVAHMNRVGNARANSIWEARLDPSRKIKAACPSLQREGFIRAKYERSQYKGSATLEGLIAACKTLGVPDSAMRLLVTKQSGGSTVGAASAVDASAAGSNSPGASKKMNPALARRLAARKSKAEPVVGESSPPAAALASPTRAVGEPVSATGQIPDAPHEPGPALAAPAPAPAQELAAEEEELDLFGDPVLETGGEEQEGSGGAPDEDEIDELLQGSSEPQRTKSGFSFLQRDSTAVNTDNGERAGNGFSFISTGSKHPFMVESPLAGDALATPKSGVTAGLESELMSIVTSISLDDLRDEAS